MTRLLLLAALLAPLAASVAVGAESNDGLLDAATRDALSGTIRAILLESLPEKISGEDDWGDTKQVFSGLTWRLDGIKLEVEKRKREKKDGLWKRWEITPVAPDQHLKFRIESARSVGPTKFNFHIVTSSPLLIQARFERWRSGVKMLNSEVEASAFVEMALVGEVDYRFETIDGRNHVVITPKATAVDLRLLQMQFHKIGAFGGAGVREMGEILADPMAKALDKQEPKAVEKMNGAIAKKQDRLKIAMPASLDFSRWSIVAGELIDSVKP